MSGGAAGLPATAESGAADFVSGWRRGSDGTEEAPADEIQPRGVAAGVEPARAPLDARRNHDWGDIATQQPNDGQYAGALTSGPGPWESSFRYPEGGQSVWNQGDAMNGSNVVDYDDVPRGGNGLQEEDKVTVVNIGGETSADDEGAAAAPDSAEGEVEAAAGNLDAQAAPVSAEDGVEAKAAHLQANSELVAVPVTSGPPGNSVLALLPPVGETTLTQGFGAWLCAFGLVTGSTPAVVVPAAVVLGEWAYNYFFDQGALILEGAGANADVVKAVVTAAKGEISKRSKALEIAARIVAGETGDALPFDPLWPITGQGSGDQPISGPGETVVIPAGVPGAAAPRETSAGSGADSVVLQENMFFFPNRGFVWKTLDARGSGAKPPTKQEFGYPFTIDNPVCSLVDGSTIGAQPTQSSPFNQTPTASDLISHSGPTNVNLAQAADLLTNLEAAFDAARPDATHVGIPSGTGLIMLNRDAARDAINDFRRLLDRARGLGEGESASQNAPLTGSDANGPEALPLSAGACAVIMGLAGAVAVAGTLYPVRSYSSRRSSESSSRHPKTPSSPSPRSSKSSSPPPQKTSSPSPRTAPARMPMPELYSGSAPQKPILSKARLDPYACLGLPRGRGEITEEHFGCPPNVPLFTTELGIESMRDAQRMNANGKRERSAGDEGTLPVFAHIPADLAVGTLIFVGISYNGACKSRPMLTVATGGQMQLPHSQGRDNFFNLIGREVWWARSATQYGRTKDFHIAVPVPIARAGAMFKGAKAQASCGMVVQQATMVDCVVLLGASSF